MSDSEGRFSARRQERPAAEPTTRDLIDGAVRKLTTTIVIASGIIGLAIYSRPGPPRFTAFAGEDGQIVRVDMRSGTVLACEGRQCMRIVQRGQRLKSSLPSMEAEKAAPPAALPAPAAKAPPSLPAPQPAEPAAKQ